MKHAVLVGVLLWAVDARADETESLRKGKDLYKLVKVAGSRSSRGFVKGVVEAPMDRVFAVITDYDRYAEFMPRCEKSRVLRRGDRSLRYHNKLDMPWPVSDVWYDADVSWETDKRSIHFQMAPGTGHGVKAFDGHWTLAAFDRDTRRTVVLYDILFESTTEWPEWVLKIGTKATLADILPSLRERLGNLARSR